MKITIGADISKASFDAAIVPAGQTPVRRKFNNKLSGFSELNLLVQTFQPESVVIVLEATSTYGDGLALFCFELGWTVYVVNPARVKAYGIARGQRNKTDRADSLTIALFGQESTALVPWMPPSPARAELRALVRERLHLQELVLAEEARQETAKPAAQKMIADRKEFLKAQLKELWKRIKTVIRSDQRLAEDAKLIQSIPGLGAWSAALLLSELPEIGPKTNARQIAALFGLVPRNVQSGTSVRQCGRLGPQGRRVVRHQLYMPAVAALHFNTALASWIEGLKSRGKTGKQIVVAVIHRLLRFVVGVLKTRQEFKPDWKGAAA